MFLAIFVDFSGGFSFYGAFCHGFAKIEFYFLFLNLKYNPPKRYLFSSFGGLWFLGKEKSAKLLQIFNIEF